MYDPLDNKAMQDATAPGRRGAVWQQLERMNVELDALHSKISALSEKLEPVTLHVNEVPVVQDVDMSGMPELPTILSGFVETITTAAKRVNTMIEMLEL